MPARHSEVKQGTSCMSSAPVDLERRGKARNVSAYASLSVGGMPYDTVVDAELSSLAMCL